MVKKQIKIWIAAGVFLVILTLVTAVLIVNGKYDLQNALDPARYDTVKVVDTLTTSSSGQMGKDYENQASDSTYQADSGGYISSGSAAAGVQNNTATKTIDTMEKAGNIIYESGLSGQYYFYEENSKEYVLWYDTMDGNLKTGVWTKIPSTNFSLKRLFNTACLSSLSKEDFNRQGASYVPKYKSLNKVFYALFGINFNRDKYFVYDLKVVVKNNLLLSISSTYEYDGSSRMTQKMVFSYGNLHLALPKVQKEYKGSKS